MFNAFIYGPLLFEDETFSIISTNVRDLDNYHSMVNLKTFNEDLKVGTFVCTGMSSYASRIHSQNCNHENTSSDHKYRTGDVHGWRQTFSVAHVVADDIQRVVSWRFYQFSIQYGIDLRLWWHWDRLGTCYMHSRYYFCLIESGNWHSSFMHFWVRFCSYTARVYVARQDSTSQFVLFLTGVPLFAGKNDLGAIRCRGF